MGKNSVIQSLSRCIGNVVMHKLLLAHTNKPESKPKLKHEIEEYGEDALEKAQEFNWNEYDKEEIKEKSIERVHVLAEYYPDVKFEEKELEKFLDETLEDMKI